jgi:hypothetical protein
MNTTTHIARTTTAALAVAVLLVMATAPTRAGDKPQRMLAQASDNGQDDQPTDTQQDAEAIDGGGVSEAGTEQAAAGEGESGYVQAEGERPRESSTRKLKRDLIEVLMASAMQRVREAIGGDQEPVDEGSANDGDGGEFEAASDADPQP